jgi:hypothetical protein
VPEVFAITPAPARTLCLLGGVCLLLAAVMATLLWVAYSSRHSRVTIEADRLRLTGDLWGRSLPLAALDLERAQILDLSRAREQRPVGRRLGTGLPGYASGWFRLANGEKALLYLTDWRRVAYLPTTEGYSLLLSVEDPQALLAALARRVGGGGS